MKRERVQKRLSWSAYLLHSFVDGVLRPLVVEVREDVLAVDQAEHAVNAEVVHQGKVRGDGLDDGRRVCEAGRLKQHEVKILPAVLELPEGLDQIAAHSAARTTVVHVLRQATAHRRENLQLISLTQICRTVHDHGQSPLDDSRRIGFLESSAQYLTIPIILIFTFLPIFRGELLRPPSLHIPCKT
eukprot:6204736-Pleurochrysis_carterae.AAC.1